MSTNTNAIATFSHLTATKFSGKSKARESLTLSQITDNQQARSPSGYEELDRVLGGGIPLSKLDAYVAAAGGLNVAEPAMDLGVAIAYSIRCNT